MHAPIHVEGCGNGRKSIDKFGWRQGEAVLREADAHKECAAMEVGRMLIGLTDVAIVLEDKLRDPCYDARLIRA